MFSSRLVTSCVRRSRHVISRPLTAAASSTPLEPNVPEHISAIVDQISKLNLIEVRDFVKLLKVRLDIPDASPMMMAAPGPSAIGANADTGAEPAVAEKTSFTVKLAAFDAVNKVKTIKEVRAITKLGLKEAKALVESAPCDIVKDISKKEGEAILEQLKATGAQVTLE